MISYMGILYLFYTFFLTPTFIQENNIIVQNCDEIVISDIENLALNLSNHSFIPLKYDCTQFSQTLVDELNKRNISSYCVFGIFNRTGLHTWVEVLIDGKIYPIEAVGGYIIPDEIYSLKYKVLKKGFCF